MSLVMPKKNKKKFFKLNTANAAFVYVRIETNFSYKANAFKCFVDLQ